MGDASSANLLHKSRSRMPGSGADEASFRSQVMADVDGNSGGRESREPIYPVCEKTRTALALRRPALAAVMEPDHGTLCCSAIKPRIGTGIPAVGSDDQTAEIVSPSFTMSRDRLRRKSTVSEAH